MQFTTTFHRRVSWLFVPGKVNFIRFNYPREKRTHKDVVSPLGIRSNRESERINVGYFNKCSCESTPVAWRGKARSAGLCENKMGNRYQWTRKKKDREQRTRLKFNFYFAQRVVQRKRYESTLNVHKNTSNTRENWSTKS